MILRGPVIARAAFAAFCLAASACAPRTAVRSTAAASVPASVRIPDVPFFPDDTDQCGPSSLASLLNFWGEEVTPAELKASVYVQRLKGSLPMDMLPALREHGLQGQIISGNYDLVRQELRAGRPMIAYLDFGTRRHPIGHYVVITGYDDHRGGLYVHSARRQDKFASYGRFDRGWSDTDRWLLVTSSLTMQSGSISYQSSRSPRYKPALSAAEYVELGGIYAAQNKPAEAMVQYQRATQVDKKCVPAWVALGNNAFENKDYNAAEKYFGRALKINPSDPASNNNLAMVYLAQNRHLDRAEKLASKAVSTPLKPYAYDTLAQIHFKRGNITAARAAIANALHAAEGNEVLVQDLRKTQDTFAQLN